MVRIFEKEGNLVAENRYYALEYDLSGGFFSIMDIGRGDYVIRNAYSGIVFRVGIAEVASCNADKVVYSVERHARNLDDAGCRITISNLYMGFKYILIFFVPETRGYLLLQTLLVNESLQSVKIENIDVLRIGEKNKNMKRDGYLSISEDPQTCTVYTNTYYKTPSMVRRLSDGFDCRFLEKDGDIKYFDRDKELGWQAKYDGLIYDTLSKRSLVFGFITFYRFMGEIELRYDRKQMGGKIRDFGLINTCRDYVLGTNEKCSSETIYLNFCGDVHENHMHYAEMTGKTMNAKCLEHPPFGWCSWHYRFFDINEEVVLKNAEFAASRKDVFPVMRGGFSYVQVDYGWQKYIGSNEVDTSRFPRGMKYVADRIHALGLKAGIWIAPFWIDEGCGLHKTNPDYLLHDEDGNLIRIGRGFKDMPYYRLDVSNPGAVEYVIGRIDQIINEWGYDMIKMDFLELATELPFPEEKKIRFFDPSLPSLEHFRNACSAIQNYVESLNKDIFMSPCGSPAMFLTGIFRSNYVAEDAVVKLSPDSWDEHAGVKAFVRSWATKYYLNNRVWTNNCESVILDERRPFNEALINATAAALTGGLYFTGDELPKLPGERLKIYSRILPLYKETAVPVDIYEGINPVTWKLAIKTGWEEWAVIGLFNLEDFEVDINLEFKKLGMESGKEYLAFDFWNQRFIGVFKEYCMLRGIPARTVKLICLRENKGRPQLVSTDIHFTQGAAELCDVSWDDMAQSLEGVLNVYRTGDHRLFLYVPEGYKLKDFYPQDADVEMKDDNICVFSVTPRESGLKKFMVRFDQEGKA